MSPQICFFHRRKTAAPFHMKIVKHACDTNTNIDKKIQNFLKTFSIFFMLLFTREPMLPGAKTPALCSCAYLVDVY